MVDSPVFDAEGNLYVTFSGSRGQESPVSIFVVRPDGSREPFVTEVPNATSLAFDDEGRLHVSSRFDGSVYRIEPDGSAVQVATDLGVACGIAFGPDGALYVGDRSGTVVRVRQRRRPSRSRGCPRAWRRITSRSAPMAGSTCRSRR
jgi:sugar lactone lactonase YvrE